MKVNKSRSWRSVTEPVYVTSYYNTPDDGLTEYVVALRAESRVHLKPGEQCSFGPFQTEFQPTTITLATQYAPASDGILIPSRLVLTCTIKSDRINGALAAAKSAANDLSTDLAFAHNAHVGAPEAWYLYEVASAGRLRKFAQTHAEIPPPSHLASGRRFDADMFRSFLQTSKDHLSTKRRGQLYRAKQFYNLALGQWEGSRALFAGQLIFMAAEGLTELARPTYYASQGKTEEKLLERYIADAIQSKGAIPEGATTEQRARILEVFQRVGTPGFALSNAKSKLDADIRRETIFASSKKSHDALNTATNVLEHGYDSASEVRKHLLPHVDPGARCVRHWVLQQTVEDPTLFAAMTTGPYELPLPVRGGRMIVNGEFESPEAFPIVPLADPFKLTPRRDRQSTAVEPDAQSQLPAGLEMRNLQKGITWPADTLDAEIRANAIVMRRMFNYEPAL